jgi:hypothetical protein
MLTLYSVGDWVNADKVLVGWLTGVHRSTRLRTVPAPISLPEVQHGLASVGETFCPKFTPIMSLLYGGPDIHYVAPRSRTTDPQNAQLIKRLTKPNEQLITQVISGVVSAVGMWSSLLCLRTMTNVRLLRIR